MTPFFSLITVTWNAEKVISPLINSIRGQVFDSFEWIVMDGASVDRTRDLVQDSGVKNLLFKSEKDDGIYDAMNKALKLVRGQYILFLGADDFLADAMVLEKARAALMVGSSPCDALIGSVCLAERKIFRSVVGFKTLVLNSVHHQAAFYAKSLFANFNYRTDISVVADYELNLILLLTRANVVETKEIISICGDGGVSNTTSEFALYVNLHHIRKKHIGVVVSSALLFLGLINVVRRKVFW